MDDDFEDILRDSGDPDAQFSSPEKPSIAKLPPSNLLKNIDERSIPSDNELKLGKRVLELEKERDQLAAEIASLKSLQSDRHHPTIPIPPSSSSQSNQPIEIPPSLIPVLAVLRKHIDELTRDNQALRYTFLGPNPPSKGTIKTSQNSTISSPLPIPVAGAGAASVPMSSASSSKLTLDIDMNTTVPSPNPGTATTSIISPLTSSTIPPDVVDRGLSQIDLEKVLDRVKDLIKENEELGEMILESGRSVDMEKKFEEALADSRNVISSLDSDLTHHLSVFQSLRAELSSYKTHFGPIPSFPSSSSSTTTSTLNAPSKHPASPSNASTPPRHPREHAHSRHPSHRDGSNGRDRDRSRNDRDRDRERDGGRRYDHNGSGPGSGSVGGRSAGGERGARKDDRDRGGSSGVGAGIGGGSNGNQLSIRGSANANNNNNRNGNGDGIKGDDRAYKRRR